MQSSKCQRGDGVALSVPPTLGGYGGDHGGIQTTVGSNVSTGTTKQQFS